MLAGVRMAISTQNIWIPLLLTLYLIYQKSIKIVLTGVCSDNLTNSVNPDQIATVVWSEFTCFAKDDIICQNI